MPTGYIQLGTEHRLRLDAVVEQKTPFKAKRRTNIPTEIVVHESVTRSAGVTERVLRGKDLGVHFQILPDGVIWQHNDPIFDRLAHAESHNGPSIGIEVVNPYEPRHLKTGDPWTEVISDAPWAHGDAYVVPTLAQCYSLVELIRVLRPFPIPEVWWGFIAAEELGKDPARFALGRVAGTENRRGSGIYAHHYFAHADAAFPVLVAFLVLGWIWGGKVENLLASTMTAREWAIAACAGAKDSVLLP